LVFLRLKREDLEELRNVKWSDAETELRGRKKEEIVSVYMRMR